MEVIGRPDLAASPELADNAGRVGHVAMLDDAISHGPGDIRWTPCCNA